MGGGGGAAATLYTCNMYDVSTEGVNERMINVHYYYTAASVLVLIVPETGVCEGENNNNHSPFLYTSVSCALNSFALVHISLMCSQHLCSCTHQTHVLSTSLLLYTSVLCALNSFALVLISLVCCEQLCSCTHQSCVL